MTRTTAFHFWRNQRLWVAILQVGLILTGLWAVVIIGLMIHIHNYGLTDRAEPADVIIVLGAGLRRDGSPGPALWRRGGQAADLYAAGMADHIICTGGLGPGRPRSEAEACQEVLMRNGVPENAIALESQSRSTEENALFTRRIMEENGWQRAVLVSDSYHLFRAEILFQQTGVDVVTSPVPPERIRGRMFYLSSVLREVAALHWQVFKDTFNLPFTYVP